MKKSYRVKRKRDFNDLFTQGKNVANRKFVVYRLPKEQEHFRVGLSVSKKLGNAVVRNSIKRKIRHVLMEFSPNLTTDDFVVIARKGVENLSYQEVRDNLRHVLKLATIYQKGETLETETKMG
ncbi:ribonuclease P protein component [Streptococcus sp. X16XC17]|uniref:ribonuclease P protein component n=1 Tax=Streptococcus sp. X16XC17 TaxID=2316646 RepID=UPI001039EC9E|nr:ribonuclease P protein component [Streptococcus sp. X16XC17]TCD45813.1 ribonuclease P protein component [Streptococcus sp. X16XC17]